MTLKCDENGPRVYPVLSCGPNREKPHLTNTNIYNRRHHRYLSSKSWNLYPILDWNFHFDTSTQLYPMEVTIGGLEAQDNGRWAMPGSLTLPRPSLISLFPTFIAPTFFHSRQRFVACSARSVSLPLRLCFVLCVQAFDLAAWWYTKVQ